jgi:hypothetical protein
MEESRRDPAGLGILRVWLEDGAGPVRARLITVDDLATGGAPVVRWTGSGSAAAAAEVRAWLEAWEPPAGPPPPD